MSSWPVEKVMHDHVSHSRKRSIIYALLAIIVVRLAFPDFHLSVDSHQEEGVIKGFIKCLYKKLFI
jgi:hypothetical protein